MKAEKQLYLENRTTHKDDTVVVNVRGHVVVVRGHESEFNVFDVEGIPKNVSFCMLNDTPCLVTSFGPGSKVYTPIAKRTRSTVNV